MISTCPECHKPLAQFAVSCENCGWDLIHGRADVINGKPAPMSEFDVHYAAATDAIARGDFDNAQLEIKRALNGASTQHANEAIALRGYAFLKAREFAKAIESCSTAIQSGFADSRAYAWRAAAFAELHRFPDAMADLEDALEHSGSDKSQYRAMIDAFVSKARDHYGQTLAQHPDDADSFWQRGWVYLRGGSSEKAARDFKSSLKIDPGKGWAWVGLANLAFRSGDFDQAVKLASKAAENPAPKLRSAALEIRARAWARIDGSEATHEDLEKLAAVAETSLESKRKLAEVKLDLNLYASAISDCEALLRAVPDYLPALLIRGTALSRLGQYRAALKDLSAYVHAFPADSSALTERAHVLTQLNELDRALNDLQLALKHDPTSVAANLQRARTYLIRKQYDLAMSAVGRATDLGARSAEVHELLGRIRFASSDFQSAIDEFSRAIAEADSLDDKAESLFLRGTTYYDLGQFDLASSDFEASSSLRPEHAGSWIWQAAVAARQENWTEAIQALQKAITHRPSAGKQYAQLGRPIATKAISHFSKLIERGQSDASLHRSRGLAHQFIGNPERAVVDFSEVLKEAPNDLETRLRRGQLYQKLGNHRAAVQDFTYVIRRDKIHHTVRYLRAISYLAMGEIEMASSDALKAIKADPRASRYHVLRGEINLASRRLQRAIRCFDRAIALDPQNASAHRLKGAALMKMKLPQPAFSEFSRATELDPDLSEAFFGKGEILLRAGQFQSAAREFEKGIMKNPAALKGYLGKASALIGHGDFRETVLWLTKSLHQFNNELDLAQVLLKRGRAFYKMGLSTYAVNDFTICKRLLKDKRPFLAASARYARSLAHIQKAEFDAARSDLQKLAALGGDHFPAVPQLLYWLDHRDQEPPDEIYLPEKMQKMPKPKVVKPARKLKHSTKEWEIKPPFDTWVLRVDEQEFGPVPKSTLDRWVEQGRVSAGMKVVRGDWPRWKHIEKIYRDLLEST